MFELTINHFMTVQSCCPGASRVRTSEPLEYASALWLRIEHVRFAAAKAHCGRAVLAVGGGRSNHAWRPRCGGMESSRMRRWSWDISATCIHACTCDRLCAQMAPGRPGMHEDAGRRGTRDAAWWSRRGCSAGDGAPLPRACIRAWTCTLVRTCTCAAGQRCARQGALSRPWADRSDDVPLLLASVAYLCLPLVSL